MGAPLDTAAAVRLAAMNLLARREHGRVELERKLQRAGAAAELIAEALDRLQQQGLLDESRYLESYIRSRAAAGFGPLRIREELTQRGIPRSEIAEALDASGIDWQDNLQALWQRRFGVRPADARERARQGRFLLYRGFPHEMVSRVLR